MSVMARHGQGTPGSSWVASRDGATVYDEHGLHVAEVVRGGNPARRRERARLIAAAPELVASLQDVLRDVSRYDESRAAIRDARALLARIAGDGGQA